MRVHGTVRIALPFTSAEAHLFTLVEAIVDEMGVSISGNNSEPTIFILIEAIVDTMGITFSGKNSEPAVSR